MSLNLVSRLVLAFGALTIATLPAFAETSPAAAPASTAAAASPAVPAADAGKTIVKHHAKKAASHHKKTAKKEAVEKTGLMSVKPASPTNPATAATPKL